MVGKPFLDPVGDGGRRFVSPVEKYLSVVAGADDPQWDHHSDEQPDRDS
jgi:hypothetical protein